jgi:thiol-disulfide isomerase/thioredoxin
MTPLKRNILIGSIGICAGVAGIWSSLYSLDAATPKANVVPLWAAEFKDLDGKPVPMASLRGKPVVVNFWATWCGPCKEEMPDFQRFAAGPDGKKAQIVGIGIDSAANMQAFAKQLGISYQLVEGGAQGLDILTAAGDKPRALPFTIVLNAAGEPVFSRIGKVSHDELVGIAAKL